MKRIFNKILISALALPLLAGVSSCNKWLDVTSSSDTSAEKLYSTEGGFLDALAGIYQSMGTNDLYGRNCTYYVNDLATVPYLVSSVQEIKNIQSWTYTTTLSRAYFNSIWKKAYNVIANVNMALRMLEEHRDVLKSDEEYDLLKGELLAIRAYVHLDLLRMFGTLSWDGDAASEPALPYVTQYYKEPVPQLSYSETAQLLLKDIQDAIELLSHDPVTGTQSESFEETVNTTKFFSFRRLHMNYYATLALAARAYQWIGDTAQADKYARDVIDHAFASGLVSWVDPDEMLNNQLDEQRDWIFSSETLFSLQTISTVSAYSNLVLSGLLTSSFPQIDQTTVDEVLFVRVDPETGSVAGAEDLRGPAMQLAFGSTGYYTQKFQLYSASPSLYLMPMIRVSEMYYILAENLHNNGDDEGAIALLDEVRSHRGINSKLPPETDLMEELTREYYREFLGEGQIFYFAKRVGVGKLSSTFSLAEARLVYPFPREELNYGRVQK